MKTIIITGAGTGLGREMSIMLAKQGYHIVLTGRNEEALKDVKAQIMQGNGHASMLILDIRNPEDIKEKMLILNKELHLYGLVNNAGVGFFGPFKQLLDQEVEDTFATNVFGTIHMTKAILPYLENNGEGLILNIISTAGLRGKKHESIYSASKFAIRGFTESLQKEYEDSNIKFIAAYMGGMDTPFWKGSSHVAAPERFRSPQEVASLILADLHNDTIIIESKKQE
jgi:short-subunit dehydrogenase